jgi:hypothetical protein
MSAGREQSGLESRLVDFLRIIAASPDRAAFALVTDSIPRALNEVVRPMLRIAGVGMNVSPRRGLCTVFGRSLYLVDRDERLRGLRLHGVWHDSSPSGVTLELVLSRLAEGGYYRG